MIRIPGFILFAAALLLGCGAAGKASRRTALPPGLDSTTVVQASLVARQNFVSSGREKKAAGLTQMGQERLQKVDAFWQYLEKQEGEATALTPEQQAGFERALREGAKSMSAWQNFTQGDEAKERSQVARQYCLEAQRFLEEALRLNPFDKNTRLLLATTYYNLQRLFGLEKNYTRAVEILERLVRLEKGEHAPYRLLAENYFELKNYEAALANYRRAEEVMRQTAFLTPPDSATLFYYAYQQGAVLARAYDAAGALQAFERAKPLARTAQEKQDIENYLKWINWDGGNIRASEQWDRVLELEAHKQYAQVVEACRGILPTLRTARAKMAVNTKLAVMEFEYLQKPEAGVERMRQVFDALPPAAVEKPQDPEIQAILNSYGAMLYRLGVEARKKEQKKLSLAYFSKAASFRWDNVARAYLELVPLVWNTPEEAIKYGKLALAANTQLSPRENCELMSLMIKAHKSAGRFEEARRYFEDWKNCRQ
ncbi:MAG: hypothetical protein ONB48_10590 [candidate division KSB1 bacterium]|nr:hypothetical protein [candidate division KSB1 bacterium]MDZ7273935.1 hypothetical protein [candidate division KSB1 bacterium]MDZ7286091.1 hypothetical protein [candidate division KSB1 bacterium]MDZ7299123.1 hypothetical protein [candidate division KSB1 bacterium]MDZ7306670.1 hypothetical protein [candidate division KSB1 bacterium]